VASRALDRSAASLLLACSATGGIGVWDAQEELVLTSESFIIDLVNARISAMESVLRLSTSKRLKDHGYPQEQSVSGWIETANGASVWGLRHWSLWSAAAPTTEEILKQLPTATSLGRRHLTLSTEISDGVWVASYIWRRRKRYFVGQGATITEALAELWIAVREGGDAQRPAA
jgi:hypothetical protein